MSSNYGLILVVLTFVSGIIWLIDIFTTGKTRKAALAKLYEQDKNPNEETIKAVSREPIHVDYAKSFFPILLFIVVLRSFLYEPFQIPSASMKPTLVEGDFILVNKFNYGLRLPVTSKKVVEIDSPQRGDVAVFRAPHTGEDYIKRIVGLPGDTVYYTSNKELHILPFCQPELAPQDCPKRYRVNRTLVSTEKYLDINPSTGAVRENDHFSEKLGEREHEILINPRAPEERKYYIGYYKGPAPAVKFYRDGSSLPIKAYEYKVPEKSYFVMGDNRDNSEDGRYWPKTNFVPEENLVGQAVYVWLHLDFGLKSRWFSWVPTNIEFGRVGEIK
ncbi:signal peptidase I [Aliikangiella marina]|uniref:Signal peptidase I n=1 Tax=Aliikangiella marina TaxID=1712262 RepID=A0A545TDS5_9GAMM|nr:signal peptidase I [Aliikangiella marina]TQV75374.1 signal peptidase I [Aliikangiella marina]